MCVAICVQFFVVWPVRPSVCVCPQGNRAPRSYALVDEGLFKWGWVGWGGAVSYENKMKLHEKGEAKLPCTHIFFIGNGNLMKVDNCMWSWELLLFVLNILGIMCSSKTVLYQLTVVKVIIGM